MKERGFFSSPKHPQAGKITMPAIPYRFSRSEYGSPDSAPGLGEHNRQVYGELGITDEEIEKLRDEGVI
jgi:crotonobetainyl-CoA:carnitine CoA-transferase CaiB-like acyl-CoA transferase